MTRSAPPSSPAALPACRRFWPRVEGTIAAFRRAILGCNVLVFTLGLTESWQDRELGVEYPILSGRCGRQFRS